MSLVIMLLLLLITECFAQTTYYVRQNVQRGKPRGSDSHTCEQARNENTPRNSINAGIKCLSGGDILHVGSGTYDELLFGQYTSSLECAAGDSANQPCSVIPNGIDQQNLTKLIGSDAIISSGHSPVGGGSIITLYDASKYISFEGFSFNRNATSGVYFGNAYYIVFSNNEVIGGGIKNGHESRYHVISKNYVKNSDPNCDQSTNPYPFCQHGMYVCGKDHLIADNVVLNAAYYGIQVSCEGGGIERVAILRNRVENAYSVGIRSAGTESVVGSNLLLNNGIGITLSGSGLVSQNTIHNRMNFQQDPYGIYLSYGNWSSFQVVNNILTQQKSSFYAIADASFQEVPSQYVHNNLCEQAGNNGCTIIAAAGSIYNEDFTLKSDSVAVGAGTESQIKRDLNKVQFAAPPDLGSYTSSIPAPIPPPSDKVIKCSGELGAKGVISLECRSE